MTPILEDLNKKYVARTPHMRDIGMRIVGVDQARGTMVLPARADWLGDPARGLLHPGPLTVLADSACGLAVGAALEKRMPYATLDLRMDYLRPAGPDQDVTCEAECYRVTRSVAFIRADVWQADRAQPIATATASFMLSTPAGTRPATPGGVSMPEAPAVPSDASVATWSAPAASEPVLRDNPVPYLQYLGLRVSQVAGQPLFRMPYQEKLIGNPRLPAIHGGVIAGFAESAAILHLIQTLRGNKLPKSIDFSIDYLRAGRPEETFASCEVVRLGSRVAMVQVRCWQRSPDYPITVSRGHFLLAEPES
ncbi:MAG TPA: hotdog domain-containing protein [Burkholderiaceae bacterium]|jgi:uncharacterized protein (TIGR00369 family)|nr:hotdog domain-containing protein [Burkholderiaceae bacterium]